MLLCGIGATSVAIAHLVAHSFYKAHAFLSSGSAVDAARVAVVPGDSRKLPAVRILASYLITASILWGVATLMGFARLVTPTNLGMASIMLVALSHLMAQAMTGKPSLRVIGRTALSVTLTALSLYALERAGATVLASAVPEARASGAGSAIALTAGTSRGLRVGGRSRRPHAATSARDTSRAVDRGALARALRVRPRRTPSEAHG